MGGKGFFTGVLSSKREFVGLVVVLVVIFLSAFFVSGAIARKVNSQVVATNGEPVTVAKTEGQSLGKEKEEERQEDLSNKKLGREQKKINTEKQTTAQGQDNSSEDKVAYLTFDDGPSATVTPRILDTLHKYDVKATFFVIGNMVEKNPNLLMRELNDGHIIGNHTYSHNMNYIYSSTKAFIDDLIKGEDAIKSVINDYNSKLIRFPGGSFHREQFQKAAVDAGYHYVDWNIDSEDTKQVIVPADTIINVVLKSCPGKKKVVILMHDAPVKATTADALPRIIEYLKEQGYSFKTLE